MYRKGINGIRRKAVVFLAGVLLAGTLSACTGQPGAAPGEAEDISQGEQSGVVSGEHGSTDSTADRADAGNTDHTGSLAGAEGAKAGKRPQLLAGTGSADLEQCK